MSKTGIWLKFCALAALAGYLSGPSAPKGNGITKKDKMDMERFDLYKSLKPISLFLWFFHPRKAFQMLILQKSMEIAWRAAQKLKK